jgi:GNAT superfamily N-acetyltransferase
MAAGSGPFLVEPFDKRKHKRTAFSCGANALDQYLKTQASQDQKNNFAAVYVACDEAQHVTGYFTLSSSSIPMSDLPEGVTRRLPGYPSVPVTLLGRLAVHEALHGHGLGRALLFEAFMRSYENSRKVASFAVVVDAKDEVAQAFYMKRNLVPFPDHPMRLYIRMDTIAKLA